MKLHDIHEKCAETVNIYANRSVLLRARKIENDWLGEEVYSSRGRMFIDIWMNIHKWPNDPSDFSGEKCSGAGETWAGTQDACLICEDAKL